jgi:hypothetical protein
MLSNLNVTGGRKRFQKFPRPNIHPLRLKSQSSGGTGQRDFSDGFPKTGGCCIGKNAAPISFAGAFEFGFVYFLSL